MELKVGMRTWVSGLAIGTCVVPRDILNEVLEGLLVARLLALAEVAAHVHCRRGRGSVSDAEA